MTEPAEAKARILLVEDEPEVANLIATELRFEGYAVQHAPDGMAGLLAARQDAPDLILLDRMLPALDGLELCARLRQTSDVPIIVVSARGSTQERIEGLRAGANDYLAKPFDLEELVARVEAQLRTRRPRPRTRFEFEGLSLDLESREVRRQDLRIELTPKEFDLLTYLLRHPRQVRTREQILMAVWGYDFNGEDNVLEVYIRYLRHKIERPEWPKLIHTVRGIGYVMREPAA